MHKAGADQAEGLYQIWDTRKWFVSSEGHRIDQHIRECGGGISRHRRSVTARPSAAPTRPTAGQYGTRGWELVERAGPARPTRARVADEARALLTAPLCPAGETTLILGGEQMALQIHESVGHAIELDRILGWEAAFAGTSWLDLAQLGSLRYGSELMNITIDPTHPGRARLVRLRRRGHAGRAAATRCATGIWVGVLAGRDSAAVAGLDYAGSVRADGWARLPMVRMTNVGLEPGPHTLEEMIAATDDGILWTSTGPGRSTTSGSTSSSAARSAGRSRTASSAGCCATRPTPASARSSGDRWTCSSSEIVAWGTPNCGKGQPGQVGHTGHPAAPARFPTSGWGCAA